MLIEKQDAIFALRLLQIKFQNAGMGEATNAIAMAMVEIEGVKETPPKFYLIDERTKIENTNDNHVDAVSSSIGVEGGA